MHTKRLVSAYRWSNRWSNVAGGPAVRAKTAFDHAQIMEGIRGRRMMLLARKGQPLTLRQQTLSRLQTNVR